jgi:hypothetical protein
MCYVNTNNIATCVPYNKKYKNKKQKEKKKNIVVVLYFIFCFYMFLFFIIRDTCRNIINKYRPSSGLPHLLLTNIGLCWLGLSPSSWTLNS